MDKLRAITLFCRTVEARSFASAAHDLSVAPSVVSKTIVALEANLRFTLFNRTTRRLSLTEAGASYYENCRQLLAGLEEAEALARDGMVRAKGTLRFGVHPVFRTALMRKLGGFLAAHPDIKIEAVATNSPAALLDDGLDVVFTIGELADSAFVARRLGWTALLTCAAPSYLEACGRPHHPADLTRYGAVIPGRRDEDSFAHWEFIRGVEHVDVDVPVVFVALDGIGIVDVAAAGIGVAKIYDLSATPLIQAGDLEIVLPEWGAERKPLYAVLPSQRNVPAKVRVFVEFVQSFFRQAEVSLQSESGGNRQIQVIP